MRFRLVIAGLLALASLALSLLVACGGPAFMLASGGAGEGEGSDGGGASDGGVNARGPFCPNDAYDFCADFDLETLSAEWNNVSTSGGGAGAEDDDASVSAPNSYLATSPALTTPDASAHAILTELSLPKGQTHFAFDLRIDEISFPSASDPTAAVVAAAYAQGPNYALALEFHPVAAGAAPFEAAVLELSTTAGTTTPKLTSLPGVLTTVGIWYRVAVDFTIDSASNPAAVPASLSVTSGSPPTTVTKLVTLNPPLGTALGARSISVGIEATATTGVAKLRFDNVTYSH